MLSRRTGRRPPEMRPREERRNDRSCRLRRVEARQLRGGFGFGVSRRVAPLLQGLDLSRNWGGHSHVFREHRYVLSSVLSPWLSSSSQPRFRVRRTEDSRSSYMALLAHRWPPATAISQISHGGIPETSGRAGPRPARPRRRAAIAVRRCAGTSTPPAHGGGQFRQGQAPACGRCLSHASRRQPG